MRTLFEQMRSAIAPWDSPDSVREELLDGKGNIRLTVTGLTHDEESAEHQREIDYCLNCPYPNCRNCLQGKKKRLLSEMNAQVKVGG